MFCKQYPMYIVFPIFIMIFVFASICLCADYLLVTIFKIFLYVLYRQVWQLRRELNGYRKNKAVYTSGMAFVNIQLSALTDEEAKPMRDRQTVLTEKVASKEQVLLELQLKAIEKICDQITRSKQSITDAINNFEMLKAVLGLTFNTKKLETIVRKLDRYFKIMEQFKDTFCSEMNTFQVK